MTSCLSATSPALSIGRKWSVLGETIHQMSLMFQQFIGPNKQKQRNGRAESGILAAES